MEDFRRPSLVEFGRLGESRKNAHTNGIWKKRKTETNNVTKQVAFAVLHKRPSRLNVVLYD
ncbi:hypothetical protein OUZ56_002376 [Daphnia magna]|uniref:Uncharacterized protein n=1 Tax=Daphnia magna TaxID=35525 RepID=A0ABR0A5Y0_9CRUS|nr:hypothetical protein OUZ56_002376 [Daphnia magna]